MKWDCIIIIIIPIISQTSLRVFNLFKISLELARLREPTRDLNLGTFWGLFKLLNKNKNLKKGFGFFSHFNFVAYFES